jgi:hypothetical protein
MGIGESSMPYLLSFKEDNLCQKPSSAKLLKGTNWRIVEDEDPHPLPLFSSWAITHSSTLEFWLRFDRLIDCKQTLYVYIFFNLFVELFDAKRKAAFLTLRVFSLLVFN